MASSSMPDLSAEDYRAAMQRIRDSNSKIQRDLVLVYKGREFFILSHVLTPRSKFFGDAVDDHSEEGSTKRIPLPDDDRFLINRLLVHCYMEDYASTAITIHGVKEKSHVSAMQTNVLMYALADKYLMEGLKKEALWKFGRFAEAKALTTEQLLAIVKTVPLIYSTTPDADRGLRDYVVAFGAKHIQKLQALQQLKEVCAEAPSYMIAIAAKCDKKESGK